jgi:hypothetical protein
MGRNETPPGGRDVTQSLSVPYGYAAAIEGVGATAAPLLAGFAFALIGLILHVESKMRWPNVALALLMSAAVSLIAAVQCSFTARQYYVPPDEWKGWLDLASRERQTELQDNQAIFLERHHVWRSRVRYAYNFGIALLFLAVATSLVPPQPIGKVPVAREIAIAVALLGLVGEMLWTLSGEKRKWTRKFGNWRIKRKMAATAAQEAGGEATSPRTTEPPAAVSRKRQK